MNLHVVYRTCPFEAKAPRPSFFSKTLALESLVKSVRRAQEGIVENVTWTFICDAGAPPECEPRMAALGDLVTLFPGRGDSGSYRAAIGHCLTQSWNADDVAYLCEDDYLHTEEAITEVCTLLGAGKSSYATGYYHPDNDRSVELSKFAERHDDLACGTTAWRPVLTTCLTFGTTAAQLHADAWLHLLVTRAPRAADFDLWHLLTGEGTRFARFFGDAPVVGDRYLVLHGLRQLLARAGVPPWSRAGGDADVVRPALVAPSRGLATHLVTGGLSPGRDWASIGRGLARTLPRSE